MNRIREPHMATAPCTRRSNGLPDMIVRGLCACVLAIGLFGVGWPAQAQDMPPTVVDPTLAVRPVITGLTTPTSMAFLNPTNITLFDPPIFWILEKNTGRVLEIFKGRVNRTLLDLAVNFASERGLLGIALHPRFPLNPSVYLYWTESTTGQDTSDVSETPLLGNRVDKFLWRVDRLVFDRTIIRLRAWQPAFPPFEEVERGNHNGGVLRFGPDGKLYILVGDVGRRGWMQNVTEGFGPDSMDDQFGGPEPDDAHLTGVVLRLNDDGSIPDDNPFFAAGEAIINGEDTDLSDLIREEVREEVGRNIQKVFSYGHRNSFGMAFDPFSRDLWVQENGDDAFSEINRVEPGMNSGWVQIMGPVERIEDYKAIETDDETVDPVKGSVYFGLQQERWPPTLIADTPEEALDRLFMLPGAHFADPAFSWLFVIEPGGIGFLQSRALGLKYEGDLFLGGARDFLEGGHLFRMRLTDDRREIAVDDPLLEDRVADNNHTWDLTQSESLLFGRNFGVVTDIQTGPNGNLFVVSLSHGAVYEISRRVPVRLGQAPGEGSP